MIDEIRTKFRQRFLDTARGRLVRIRSPEADSGVLATELHALAGEASVLEFGECSRLARLAEQHARAGEGRKCREVIEEVAKAVDALAS